MLFKTGLFFHIAGIFLIGGGSLGSRIAESFFWKNVQAHKDHLTATAGLLPVFSKIIIAGVLTMLASGIVMLSGTHWIFWGQPWLTLKLFIFVLLVLNGRLTGSRIVKRILVQANSANHDQQVLKKLRNDSQMFHSLQYIMLTILIAIVIFLR